MSQVSLKGFSLSKKRGSFLKRLIISCMLCIMLFGAGIAVASTEGGHEGGETKGWVATDWYRVMNFGVLAAALFFLLKKPASEALSGRIKSIQEQLSTLEAAKASAEKKLADYDKKISSLDEEAEKIIAEYRKQGEAARDRILKEAEASAAKLEDQARRTIEYEFKVAKDKLQHEILEKALIKAEEIITTKITSEDQDRLIDEYLSKVGEK